MKANYKRRLVNKLKFNRSLAKTLFKSLVNSHLSEMSKYPIKYEYVEPKFEKGGVHSNSTGEILVDREEKVILSSNPKNSRFDELMKESRVKLDGMVSESRFHQRLSDEINKRNQK